ncbi:MAG: GTP 3',8-cyclase MoaA [Saprospiraceae bacterium]|nr:GTP 3',8-cyclase MoaA [Saprospiraceae bacterium]
MKLIDNHGRQINYLRLAVTDRCNLRCFYCMPEKGIDYVERSALMSFEELMRLVDIVTKLGITKLRVTGGEPFLRKDLLGFLQMLKESNLEEVHITTNGTLTHDAVPQLKDLGIRSVNLSLDSLDRNRFDLITRRDRFETVWRTFIQLLTYKIPTKINMVVMNGQNIADLIPMAELARKYEVDVRFIEEMPFNGTGSTPDVPWTFRTIHDHLKAHFPTLALIPAAESSTASKYSVQGFKGSLGIIAAASRTFCGSCNRLRVTPQGMLRTCLYGEGTFNLKDMMRAGATDPQIMQAIVEAVGNRAKDGFEAESSRKNGIVSESMASIGG